MTESSQTLATAFNMHPIIFPKQKCFTEKDRQIEITLQQKHMCRLPQSR